MMPKPKTKQSTIKFGIKMMVIKTIIVSHISHKSEKLFIMAKYVKINGRLKDKQKYQYAEKNIFIRSLCFKYFKKK